MLLTASQLFNNMSSTSYVPPSSTSPIHLPSESSDRDKLLESWQYIAGPEFQSYAHWESITPTSNELTDAEGQPATIIIVGQVVTDKLAVYPLGNFQIQEEKQQRYQDPDTNKDSSCLNSKMVIVIRRPTAPLWRPDYDNAVSRLNTLQEKVAKGSAPRQHLLLKDHEPPFVRVTFPLWEKKVSLAIVSI
jgi:hypothetical protein